jgi:hypothetical protein
MSIRFRLVRHQVALGTVCSLMLAPVAPLVAAPRPAAVKPSPPIDGGWPKSYVTPTGASVTLYQPQVGDWKNQKQLTLYAAVAYTPSGATKPVLGTVTAEAQTKVSVSDRLVDFSVFTITDSNFPTLDKGQMQEIIAQITNAIPKHDRVIALDRVLAGIDKSQIIPKNNDHLKADPPIVFYSTRPAVVVNINGARFGIRSRAPISITRSIPTGTVPTGGRMRCTARRQVLAQGGDDGGRGRQRARCRPVSASCLRTRTGPPTSHRFRARR